MTKDFFGRVDYDKAVVDYFYKFIKKSSSKKERDWQVVVDFTHNPFTKYIRVRTIRDYSIFNSRIDRRARLMRNEFEFSAASAPKICLLNGAER